MDFSVRVEADPGWEEHLAGITAARIERLLQLNIGSQRVLVTVEAAPTPKEATDG